MTRRRTPPRRRAIIARWTALLALFICAGIALNYLLGTAYHYGGTLLVALVGGYIAGAWLIVDYREQLHAKRDDDTER